MIVFLMSSDSFDYLSILKLWLFLYFNFYTSYISISRYRVLLDYKCDFNQDIYIYI